MGFFETHFFHQCPQLPPAHCVESTGQVHEGQADRPPPPGPHVLAHNHGQVEALFISSHPPSKAILSIRYESRGLAHDSKCARITLPITLQVASIKEIGL